MGRCSTKTGKNTVKGSVTNRHSGTQDYAVQVTWVAKGRGGSVTAAAVLAQVAPGVTARWQLTATLKAPASQCLLAVQRGTLH